MPVTLQPTSLKYKDSNGVFQNATAIQGESPVVAVADITNGHRITITDAEGAHSFNVMDGNAADAPVQDVQVNGSSVLSSGVANVPVASDSTFGAVKINENNGIGVSSSGNLQILQASASQIKAGTIQSRTITPAKQNESTFYGLAKAAGDSTQAASSNPVGTYTNDAKTAIKTMLGVTDPAVTDVQVNGTSVLDQYGVANIPIASASTPGVILSGSVNMTGTTVSITALRGLRYVCEEVATLNFTPSATGICDVVFTSGSTPTVLTVPNTIKWPAWFDPTNLEANVTYELNVMDGVYGTVGVWN